MKKKFIQKAAALKFRPEKDRAPKVTAKGSGRFAEKIIAMAKEYDIPIKDDPDLLEVLTQLDIEEEIPSELYLAVAEILAFIYLVNGKKRPDSA